jgi:hypothetical protein
VKHGTVVSNEAEFEKWLALALENERQRLREESTARNSTRSSGCQHAMGSREKESRHGCQ